MLNSNIDLKTPFPISMNDSNLFLKQLYQREDARSSVYADQITVENFLNHAQVEQQIEHYKSILPTNKDCKILDIGVGEGWFAAICSHLGYKHIEMAELKHIHLIVAKHLLAGIFLIATGCEYLLT